MLKNINLIIVKGLSRKRINKQRKKEADEERRRRKIVEIVRSLRSQATCF